MSNDTASESIRPCSFSTGCLWITKPRGQPNNLSCYLLKAVFECQLRQPSEYLNTTAHDTRHRSSHCCCRRYQIFNKLLQGVSEVAENQIWTFNAGDTTKEPLLILGLEKQRSLHFQRSDKIPLAKVPTW